MMDRKDQKIIEELRKDSRSTISEIAKRTGIRNSTVHARIQKLVKDKVIEGFTIRTDDRLMSENFVVFVLVNTEHDIPATVFRNPRIKEVFGVTGEFDLILKCKFSDIEEFNTFILEFRKLPQIKKTLTMIGTAKIKEEL